MRYVYLGALLTDPRFVGQPCDPVRDTRGKCVVGRSKALVVFSWGEQVVVLRRRLRLADPPVLGDVGSRKKRRDSPEPRPT